MIIYSQRNGNWANHQLGWGPAGATIGLYGCFDTVFAMIANDSLVNSDGTRQAVDPVSMDDRFVAMKIFVPESGGFYDLLPDTALDQAFPGQYQTTSYSGFRTDLVDAAIPTPDTYACLWISTPTVPTHFVIAYSKGPNYVIADPWTGQLGSLAGYGGIGSVHKIILIKHINPVALPIPTPPPSILPSPPLRTMYDSTNINDIPLDAPMVGYYVDGLYAVSEATVRSRFPNAVLVPISAIGENVGIIGDVEPGCMTNAQAVEWVKVRRAAGIDPSLYVNASTWPSLRQAIQAVGLVEPHYWVAAWGADQTIPQDAMAKQYANPTITGLHYDLSAVASYWPGIDPAPVVVVPPVVVPPVTPPVIVPPIVEPPVVPPVVVVPPVPPVDQGVPSPPKDIWPWLRRLIDWLQSKFGG